MYIAFDPIYAHPLPPGHRFPMLKYELIPEQLLREGIINEAQIHAPQRVQDEDVLRVHSADYWRRMQNLELTDREMRAIGFPLSAGLVIREARIIQGTINCALYALDHKSVGLNVAGGTHHAFADKGEGFCLLNDFAVAAARLLHDGLVSKVLIVDLDVHQGNGTAAIFKEEPRVFTFSMHGRHNYPFRKEGSSLDVPLEEGTTGEEYLRILETTLPHLLDEAQPEIVLYLSGVDVLATDRFGKLALTLHDCRRRDEIVFQHCRQRGLAVAVAMGGGYSPELRYIVDAHCNTYKAAAEIFG